MVKYYIAIGRHTMDEDERGAFVRRVDYAALQASHARLLEASKRLTAAADSMANRVGDDTLHMIEFGAADFDLREAIAAAQPFAEDAK